MPLTTMTLVHIRAILPIPYQLINVLVYSTIKCMQVVKEQPAIFWMNNYLRTLRTELTKLTCNVYSKKTVMHCHSLQRIRVRHLPTTSVPKPTRREITTCTFPHHRQNKVDGRLRNGTYNPVEGEALHTPEWGMIVQTTDVKGQIGVPEQHLPQLSWWRGVAGFVLYCDKILKLLDVSLPTAMAELLNCKLLSPIAAGINQIYLT